MLAITYQEHVCEEEKENELVVPEEVQEVEFEVEKPSSVLSSPSFIDFDCSFFYSHESVLESESLYFDLSPFMFILYKNTKNNSVSGAHEKLVSLLAIVSFIDSRKKGPKKYENFYVP